MNYNNRVAKIMFYIGCIVFFVGFFTGLIIGNHTVPDPMTMEETTVVVWSIVLSYWFGSFIFGMFFIAFAEIIQLLDEQKFYAREQLNRLNKLVGHEEPITESRVDPNTNSYVNDLEISNYDKNTIQEFYEKLGKNVKEIITTPIDDFALVLLENGAYELVELGGFKPEIIATDKWDTRIKLWFEDKFKS